jgi:hypothetical protein
LPHNVDFLAFLWVESLANTGIIRNIRLVRSLVLEYFESMRTTNQASVLWDGANWSTFVNVCIVKSLNATVIK